MRRGRKRAPWRAQSFLARLGATRGGSSGMLRVLRRPRRVVQAGFPSRSARPAAARATAVGRHVGPGVAPPAHQVGHGADGEVVGDDRLDLLPGERRRDLPARAGPGEPGAEDGLVGRVLVEVDEDALAPLLLPPVGRDQIGKRRSSSRASATAAARTCTCPSAARAGGRRAGRCCPSSSDSPMPSSSSSIAAEQGDGAHLVEADAGLGVEVDAQLVGVGRGQRRRYGHRCSRGSPGSRPTGRGRCRRRRARWTSSRSAWRRWSSAASPARPPGHASGRRTCRWRRRGNAAAWPAGPPRC
jgi:hypothetical protein